MSVDATIARAHQHATNTTRPEQDTGGGIESQESPWFEVEPPRHGIGRSRGGPTTKIHQAVDGRGRPLAMVITGGQRNDGAMLAQVLAEIHVPRLGVERARTRPDAVLADRAYTSGGKPCRAAVLASRILITYRTAATISATLTWLRHMGDTL